MPPPVLVLRALKLGDALTGVPALRALRRRHPGRRLLLAASGPPADLLLDAGVVDGVVPTRDLTDPPPGLHPAVGPGHLAVNLHGRGPQSHRLLLAGRPGDLLAYASPEAGVGGPGRPEHDAGGPQEHEVARWLRLVAPGDPVDDADLLLPAPGGDLPPALDGSPAVLVHPGAAAPARCWPAVRWASVAAALLADGHRVLVTAGPGEGCLGHEVAGLAGLRAEHVVTGLPLPSMARLVARARLVLCGDTGVAHLATAYATPSVVLFGPVSPTAWGPPSRGCRHVRLWRGDPASPGDPHGRRLDPALAAIGPDDVSAAARRALAAVTS